MVYGKTKAPEENPRRRCLECSIRPPGPPVKRARTVSAFCAVFFQSRQNFHGDCTPAPCPSDAQPAPAHRLRQPSLNKTKKSKGASPLWQQEFYASSATPPGSPPPWQGSASPSQGTVLPSAG